MDATLELRTEIREFLRSRRARIAPEMAGLPVASSRVVYESDLISGTGVS